MTGAAGTVGMIVVSAVLAEAQAADEIDQLERQMYVVPHEVKLVGEDLIRAYGCTCGTPSRPV